MKVEITMVIDTGEDKEMTQGACIEYMLYQHDGAMNLIGMSTDEQVEMVVLDLLYGEFMEIEHGTGSWRIAGSICREVIDAD